MLRFHAFHFGPLFHLFLLPLCLHDVQGSGERAQFFAVFVARIAVRRRRQLSLCAALLCVSFKSCQSLLLSFVALGEPNSVILQSLVPCLQEKSKIVTNQKKKKSTKHSLQTCNISQVTLLRHFAKKKILPPPPPPQKKNRFVLRLPQPLGGLPSSFQAAVPISQRSSRRSPLCFEVLSVDVSFRLRVERSSAEEPGSRCELLPTVV